MAYYPNILTSWFSMGGFNQFIFTPTLQQQSQKHHCPLLSIVFCEKYAMYNQSTYGTCAVQVQTKVNTKCHI